MATTKHYANTKRRRSFYHRNSPGNGPEANGRSKQTDPTFKLTSFQLPYRRLVQQPPSRTLWPNCYWRRSRRRRELSNGPLQLDPANSSRKQLSISAPERNPTWPPLARRQLASLGRGLVASNEAAWMGHLAGISPADRCKTTTRIAPSVGHFPSVRFGVTQPRAGQLNLGQLVDGSPLESFIRPSSAAPAGRCC